MESIEQSLGIGGRAQQIRGLHVTCELVGGQDGNVALSAATDDDDFAVVDAWSR